MAKARYTPGPWSAFGGKGGKFFVVCGEDKLFEVRRVRYAKSLAPSPLHAYEMIVANGVLAAAAPDLLAALKHARSLVGHPDQMIDEAIAKAEFDSIADGAS